MHAATPVRAVSCFAVPRHPAQRTSEPGGGQSRVEPAFREGAREFEPVMDDPRAHVAARAVKQELEALASGQAQTRQEPWLARLTFLNVVEGPDDADDAVHQRFAFEAVLQQHFARLDKIKPRRQRHDAAEHDLALGDVKRQRQRACRQEHGEVALEICRGAEAARIRVPAVVFLRLLQAVAEDRQNAAHGPAREPHQRPLPFHVFPWTAVVAADCVLVLGRNV
jgi:hypothetical protein